MRGAGGLGEWQASASRRLCPLDVGNRAAMSVTGPFCFFWALTLLDDPLCASLSLAPSPTSPPSSQWDCYANGTIHFVNPPGYDALSEWSTLPNRAAIMPPILCGLERS